VFADCAGVEVASAGTSVDADMPISADLIEWAEIIFVMERIHERKLLERFGPLLRAKRVVILGIPDRYGYMDTELVALLRRKLSPYLAKLGLSRTPDYS
jgi:predicted protein tyrosine phosphatase